MNKARRSLVLDDSATAREYACNTLVLARFSIIEVANSMDAMKGHVPEINLIPPDELNRDMVVPEQGKISLVGMGFKGELKGKAVLVFSSEDAQKTVDLITEKDTLH